MSETALSTPAKTSTSDVAGFLAKFMNAPDAAEFSRGDILHVLSSLTDLVRQMTAEVCELSRTRFFVTVADETAPGDSSAGHSQGPVRLRLQPIGAKAVIEHLRASSISPERLNLQYCQDDGKLADVQMHVRGWPGSLGTAMPSDAVISLWCGNHLVLVDPPGAQL